MAFTSFRAGSGDYQAVRPLTLTISKINAFSTSVETYSVAAANIVSGSVADLDKDSLCLAEFAAPLTVGTGLILENSYIATAGVLTLVYYNETAADITPAAATQVNLLVL